MTEISMAEIKALDQITIDKIAAGEVIERPASIVKELVENSIDAKAQKITVEIEKGGMQLIRITDDGRGMTKEQIPLAFLRHYTSKLEKVEDLTILGTLGFRGEALASVAAVAKVELISKSRQEDVGSCYVIEGGKELSLTEAAAPDGSSFFIRFLFYNVPARQKFLKSATTESGYVQDVLLRLALSHPEISFTFIHNGQEKFRTTGNGNLKEVIYALYGREISNKMLALDYEKEGLSIKGFIGRPEISRGNRSYETILVNHRYIKSSLIAKSIEDAYKGFTMTNKFPFAVLHLHLEGEMVDVNVHPTKMEVRFQNHNQVYQTIYEAVHRTLLEPELIPSVSLEESPKPKQSVFHEKPLVQAGEVAERNSSPYLLRPSASVVKEEAVSYSITKNEAYYIEKMQERVRAYHKGKEVYPVASPVPPLEEKTGILPEEQETENAGQKRDAQINPEQLSFIEKGFLQGDEKPIYQLIGQAFDTYWLITFQEALYIIDQHAAHEKVLYERTLINLKNKEHTSQQISPPIILKLQLSEQALLEEHKEEFSHFGFEIEPFGGDEFAVRAVPGNLYSLAKRELLLEMLDSLASGMKPNSTSSLIEEKIALYSCRGAVKGRQSLSALEVDNLIAELLTLENPYFCPHGRPTIISFSRKELEKKFKRIL